ncbi:MAG TPA: hypothetical protein VFW49_07435, partial [Fluviicoccus sp.]|nr:hypothetical protein [Fluviicoccus sp.]
MSRTKSSTGVQATLERLTNRKPCPEYLRHTANKYLRSNQFPNNPKQPNKWSAKLESQEGQILLINALSLDEALRGATHGSPDEILAIIQGTKNKVQLAKDLEDAQQEIQRRFEV